MPEIISAKCFGCGHVVKVPSALGGKKARCPKCTNTITIPAPGDSSDDFVSDAMLPEVARDGDVLEGEEVLDEDGSPQAEPAPDAPRRLKSSSTWDKPSGTNARGREPRGGTRKRTGGGPRGRSSSTGGLVIGIAVAALAVLVVIIAVAAGGSKSAAKARPKQDVVNDPQPSADPAAENELQSRCAEYFRAVASGSHGRTMDFYIYDPADRVPVARGLNSILEQGSAYRSASVKSVRVTGDTGTTTFTTDKDITLNWRKVEGTWKIADKP